MNARTRTAIGALVGAATLVALLLPAGASAGLLTASAVNCPDRPMSQPFARWLDPLPYTLLDGGSFENGAAGWELRGGASIVDGNETHRVGGATDSRSLNLPKGSSATSSTICVGLLHPTVRFFARNKGFVLSTLRVDVHFWDRYGRERALPIGLVLNTGTWQPTLPYPVLVNLVQLLPGDRTPVAFRFVPQGLGGKWQIDDVYVDPYRRS